VGERVEGTTKRQGSWKKGNMFALRVYVTGASVKPFMQGRKKNILLISRKGKKSEIWGTLGPRKVQKIPLLGLREPSSSHRDGLTIEWSG